MKLFGKDNKSQEFYYCTTCGNLMVKLNDSGITPQCCSKTMIKVEAGDTDGSVEAHVPICEWDGNKFKVKVGAKRHPMEKEHHIQWIFIKTNRGFHVEFLNHECDPYVCLKLRKDEKVEAIYAKCNVHGLWKAKEICIEDEEELSDC